MEKALLMERVQSALMTLAKVAREQSEALGRGDIDEVTKLDKTLETALGDKERLLGGYYQHLEDHGC